jgi:hypothetical protein
MSAPSHPFMLAFASGDYKMKTNVSLEENGPVMWQIMIHLNYLSPKDKIAG